MHDPLHQFVIERLIPLYWGKTDLSFTNASLFMVLAIGTVTLFLIGGMIRPKIIPGRWQVATESMYEFIANMIEDNIGRKGQKFFPFVFSLFMFILAGNLLGLIPYAYTFTSQIIVTFTLAMIVFVLVILTGLYHHGFHFFTMFFPKGVPHYMAPLIIPIEFISFLSRPVSLSIRLFANMMAGHTMLKVFAAFTIYLGLYGVAPLFLNILLIAFELLVAILQAYVFTILTCIYLEGAIYLH